VSNQGVNNGTRHDLDEPMTKTEMCHCVSFLQTNIKQTKTNARKGKTNLQTTRDGSWQPIIKMERKGK